MKIDIKFEDFRKIFFINPFVPNTPFLYSLKTSENRKVFWCFQEVEKGSTGNMWLISGAYSEPSQTFKMLLLAKIVNDF